MDSVYTERNWKGRDDPDLQPELFKQKHRASGRKGNPNRKATIAQKREDRVALAAALAEVEAEAEKKQDDNNDGSGKDDNGDNDNGDDGDTAWDPNLLD